MAGPIRVAVQDLEKLADRAVIGDRIGNRNNRIEPENAALVGSQHGPSVRTISLCILHIVVAGRIRLPDINLHVGNGLPRGVLDRAKHQKRLPFGIAVDKVAMLHVLGFIGVKWSQYCALC